MSLCQIKLMLYTMYNMGTAVSINFPGKEIRYMKVFFIGPVSNVIVKPNTNDIRLDENCQ